MKLTPLIAALMLLLAACGNTGGYSGVSPEELNARQTAIVANAKAEAEGIGAQANAMRQQYAAATQAAFNASATARAISMAATAAQQAANATATELARPTATSTPTPEPTATATPLPTATPTHTLQPSATPAMSATPRVVLVALVITVTQGPTATKTAVQAITESPEAGRMGWMFGLLVVAFLLIWGATILGRIAIKQWQRRI